MATSKLRQTRTALGPLDAFDATRRLDAMQPLLLESKTEHPEARHSFIGLSPAITVRVSQGHVWVDQAGHSHTIAGDPLAVLQGLFDAHQYAVDEPDGVFTGGWMGYFAYEFTRHFEPTLPIEGTGDEAILRLCRDAIVIDAGGEATLWTADLPGEDDAASRRAAIIEALERSAPALPSVAAPAWRASMDEAQFTRAVGHIRDLVAAGDLFQANIATRFEADTDAPAAAWYASLRDNNPGPYMALLDFGHVAIASSSPEQLFATEGGVIRARPIAGTRPRGEGEADAALEQQLVTDAKEQAEHTMLVDLLRNDLAKVAVPGTVAVPELASVERYRRVMHLVSRVEAGLRPSTFMDQLAAVFPGGTITGAPKHRACRRIDEAEPVPRGPYTGSAGFLSWTHQAHWNILIRTLVHHGDRVHVHAGSGIVADSDPAREWAEAGHKARALLEVGAGGADASIGRVTPHGAWAPPAPEHAVEARVLVVDNYDSFVHNLADYCAALGAQTQVIRNDDDWAGAIAAFDPTHIILSPGPGRPEDAGDLLAICRHVVGRIPVLGVCLGHQALALAAGAPVTTGEPVHGKPATIRFEDSRLSDAGRRRVGRYHSLIVPAAPTGWRATAWLDDGTLMAMEHAEHPAFGLQFHPESIITDGGHEILLRFLRTR